MKKVKKTVTILAIEYLKIAFSLTNDEAHHIWSYHCRKYPYAMQARNQDVLGTKALGKVHLDAVNMSAYEWLGVNKPDHPILDEIRKLKENTGEEK